MNDLSRSLLKLQMTLKLYFDLLGFWSDGNSYHEYPHTNDKALVVNGGSFGHRFVELLELHHVPYTEIKLEHGKALKAEHLAPYEGQGYTAFLVNKHETSTGVHYDMNLISDFCKRNQLFLVVDCISTFLADPLI